MLQAIPRTEYRALIQVKNSTLDQRSFNHELALALGVERPAHRDEYLLLDGFAAILASVCNHRCGLTLRQAVDAVRETWNEWLELLTRVETWAERHQDDPQLFFGVAWLFGNNATLTHRIVLGDGADIDKALAGERVYTVNHVSMRLVLHHLHVNAAAAGITMPERLTVNPKDKSAYRKWRDEIDAYQEAAGARIARASKRLLKA